MPRELPPQEPQAAPDFRHLPERVPLDQLTTSQPASDPPSPDFGRDPDHEWMLRFGAS
jgi:hypothetical protein